FDNQTSEVDFCSVTKYCKADNGDPQDVEEAMALLQKAFTPIYFKWMFPDLLPVTLNFTTDSGCKPSLSTNSLSLVMTITTSMTDSAYLQNTSRIIHTEAAYILGVAEEALAFTIQQGNNSTKREGSVTRIIYDVSGSIYISRQF